MTRQNLPSPQALDALASRLAPPAAALFRSRKDKAPDSQLADSLPVWSISTVVADLPGTRELAALATPTRTWHHQVLVGGAPVAFARSRQVGGTLRFLSLAQAPVAERLDHALAWVDENIPGDPELRLLEVPLNRVTALWVVLPDHPILLVVDALQDTGFPPERTPLDEGEFLAMLRAAPLVRGRIRAD
jgi:hypothetical protein